MIVDNQSWARVIEQCQLHAGIAHALFTQCTGADEKNISFTSCEWTIIGYHVTNKPGHQRVVPPVHSPAQLKGVVTSL